MSFGVPTLDWSQELLREQLAPLLPGIVVEVHASIDSTNSELMRRARAGVTLPTLLVAEAQTAGRGRMGRSWQSGPDRGAQPGTQSGGKPGAALTFSLGLPMAPRDWSGLSLAAGLAVADSLHPQVRIKWPNDLWWQGRKLAGILVETAGSGGHDAPRYTVIGIGLNITALPAEGLRTPPAWLQEALPGIDAPSALLRLAAPLVQAMQAFEDTGFAPLTTRFAARDALIGQTLCLSDGIQGAASGVGPDGALHLRTDSGIQVVRSLEVSVRPMATAPQGE